jgi:iron complex outermembrane receptor protein
MKRSPHLRRVAAWLALLAAPSMDAQSAATRTPAGEEALMLSPFTVRSETDVGYYASNAISATRINVPLIDLPMSINVITSEFMQDIAAFSLDEALEYTAGVQPEGFGNNSFTVRGFTAGRTFRDGFITPGGGNEVPTSLVDRVEVVKGPSALLYGQGTAGGVVNFATKKPLAVRKHTLRFFYGSHDMSRGEFDFTGPVPHAAWGEWKVLYRLAGHYQDGDTHLDYHSIDDLAVNPMLSFVRRGNTRLDLQFTYQRRTDRGHPEAVAALATVPLTDPRFAGIIDVAEIQRRVAPDVFARLRASPGYAQVSETYNPNGPSARIAKKERVLTTTLQHSFTPNLTLRSVGMYWDHRDFNYQRVGSVETAALPGFVTQQGALRWVGTRNSIVQTDLNARFSVGPLKNQVVLGHLWQQVIDKFELYRDTDQRFPINRAPVFPADYLLGNPDSIRNGTAVWNGLTTNNNIAGSDFNFFVQNRLNENERQAVYLLDLVETFEGRLSFLGGMRIENINGSAVESQRGPFFVGEPVLSRRPSTNQHSTNLGQFAAMFKPLPDVSVYAAYSESYQPNGAFPDDPQNGTGYDAGVKFSLLKNRLAGRISYFDIELSNVQRSDLSNPDPTLRNVAVLTKGETSKGWEFDLFYTPTDRIQFVLSWANIDSAVVDNPESPDMVGTPLVETPEREIKVFATYRFRHGLLNGLRIGGGMSARSETRSFPAGERRHILNPAIERFDAFVDYRQRVSASRAMSYRLNLKNLTDERSILHHKWGPGFEWRASVGYEF